MKRDAMKLVNSDENAILFCQAIRKFSWLFLCSSISAICFLVLGCATAPSTPREKSISAAETTQTLTLDVLLKSAHYKMGLFFDELVEKRREDKKIFKAGYDEVFNALVETMSDIGNPILTMDKVNGLIVTGEEERSYYFETWKDRYSLKVTKLSQTETQAGVKRTVTKKEGRDRTGQSIWTNKASDGVMENWILNQIEQKTVKTQSPPQLVQGKTEVKPSAESTPQLPQSAKKEEAQSAKKEEAQSAKKEEAQSAKKEEAPSATSTSIPKITSTETQSILIITAAANIRSEPNNKSKTIATLKKGYKIEMLGKSGNWFNVKLSSGLTGWVFKDLVKDFK